jgi:hypothetical protein
MRSDVICNLRHDNWNIQVEEVEVGGACSVNGGKEGYW